MGFARGAVVVGFDGSPESRLALHWASTLASRRPELTVRPVAVLSEGHHGQGTKLTGSDADWLATEASTIVESHHAGSLPLDAVPGSAADCLSDLAGDAALLVVGGVAHGRVTGAMGGSVSVSVAARARCPVAVIRQDEASATGGVVVGVDGTPGSLTALDLAFDYAQTARLSLRVIHAWRPPPPDATGLLGYAGESLQEQVSHEDRRLGLLVAGLADGYPEVPFSYGTTVAPAILALSSASRAADVVVVGSRGHGPATSLILGSVSIGLLHRAHCPVLIAR